MASSSFAQVNPSQQTQQTSRADQSNFQNVIVDNLISIDLPRHWSFKDTSTRKNIAASAEALLNKPAHVASLSVVSLPAPASVIVRVSFIPLDNVTQADVKSAIAADRQGLLAELNQVFGDEFSQLQTAGASQNLKFWDKEIGIANLSNSVAFTVTYRRTSLAGPFTFRVTQYHIPMGKTKALVTISYKEEDQKIFLPIVKKITQSVRILPS